MHWAHDYVETDTFFGLLYAKIKLYTVLRCLGVHCSFRRENREGKLQEQRKEQRKTQVKLMKKSNITLGTFFQLGGRGVIECLARGGLDYVVIDTEHGYFSEESTEDYIIAAENLGLLPFVRIGDLRRPYILRMLDIGARGLIIPQIHNAEEVRGIVSYAKFPPVGKRGFCPTRTSGWGADEWAHDLEEYMRICNDRVKVLPQCETKEALENIDEIMSVPGVDGIFIGPYDLSIDLGVPGKMDSPVLSDAIARILQACEKYGKASYIYAGSMEAAARWAEMGFDSIAYGMDAMVLGDSYRALSQEFRKAVK